MVRNSGLGKGPPDPGKGLVWGLPERQGGGTESPVLTRQTHEHTDGGRVQCRGKNMNSEGKTLSSHLAQFTTKLCDLGQVTEPPGALVSSSVKRL